MRVAVTKKLDSWLLQESSLGAFLLKQGGGEWSPKIDIPSWYIDFVSLFCPCLNNPMKAQRGGGSDQTWFLQKPGIKFFRYSYVDHSIKKNVRTVSAILKLVVEIRLGMLFLLNENKNLGQRQQAGEDWGCWSWWSDLLWWSMCSFVSLLFVIRVTFFGWLVG